jgi:hypothetical protein
VPTAVDSCTDRPIPPPPFLFCIDLGGLLLVFYAQSPLVNIFSILVLLGPGKRESIDIGRSINQRRTSCYMLLGALYIINVIATIYTYSISNL